MSGTSNNETCPKCGRKMKNYYDWKQHQYVSRECLHCGFAYATKEYQMSLNEVNEIRTDMELKPLKKLKQQIYGT
jgi:Zn ribbon nucleic-acid-binding protein